LSLFNAKQIFQIDECITSSCQHLSVISSTQIVVYQNRLTLDFAN